MQKVADSHEILIHALDLFHRSPIHREWSVTDFIRLVLPPLQHEQIILIKDDEDVPLGVVTWAWLSPEAEAGFLNRTRKLQPDDWAKQSDADRAYVIDLIAPGHAPMMVREVRDRLIQDGAQSACWYRSLKGRHQTYTRKDR